MRRRRKTIYLYREQRHGSNLTEVVVATLIVGLMLIPAMNNVGISLRSRTANAALHDGRGLAQQLMSEVLQSPYEDPNTPGQPIGTDAKERTSTRTDWDDVDDYDAWSKSPPQDKTGNPLRNYNGWSRSVTVDWVIPTIPSKTIATDRGLKRITVTATSPSGEQTTLVTLRSSAGAMEQTPASSCPITYQTWIGCNLQIGNASEAAAAGGVNLLNHSKGP